MVTECQNLGRKRNVRFRFSGADKRTVRSRPKYGHLALTQEFRTEGQVYSGAVEGPKISLEKLA